MIGRINGVLIEKEPPELLIDVQGVGYEVQAPMTTVLNLPDVGEPVTLYTHLSVSENAHNLYAFGSKSDRQLFRELIKVNGVGPKLAVAILSGMTTQEFVACVHQGDANLLVKLPGVGKKTAERLIIEMRDRLKNWEVVALGSNREEQKSGNPIVPESEVEKEAVSGLIALGYKPQDASRAISRLDENGLTSGELIRLALKNMAK